MVLNVSRTGDTVNGCAQTYRISYGQGRIVLCRIRAVLHMAMDAVKVIIPVIYRIRAVYIGSSMIHVIKSIFLVQLALVFVLYNYLVVCCCVVCILNSGD